LRLEFAEEHLQRLAQEVAYSAGMGSDVVRAYRKTVQLLCAAKDLQDLRALRSVGLLEPVAADGHEHSFVPLTGSLRLTLEFAVRGDVQAARLLSIEDRDNKGVVDDN
jgi:plasmid maintenance system killer protein